MKHDWEAAASVEERLWHAVYQLHVLALAADGFDNSPGGIEGLSDLCTQIANAWHIYASKLLDDSVPDKLEEDE